MFLFPKFPMLRPGEYTITPAETLGEQTVAVLKKLKRKMPSPEPAFGLSSLGYYRKICQDHLNSGEQMRMGENRDRGVGSCNEQ